MCMGLFGTTVLLRLRISLLLLLCLASISILSIFVGPSWSLVNEDVPRSPFVAVGREVRPAVVSIRTIRTIATDGMDTGPLQEMFRQFFPDEEGGQANRFEKPGSGSGFLVSEDGDILTNHHVIADADAVFVRFAGDQIEYQAEVRGTDPNTDLALLQIDPADREIPSLPFGDSDLIEVGDWAIAIGNPFGNLEGSLTVGVVSAKGRSDLVIAGLTPRYQDFIQTDASINFGNSGGPLVDLTGKIIGVNTAINAGGQGIGFAVPCNLAQWVYQQLRLHGRVIRGYLGVVTEDLLVAEKKADDIIGVRVVSVTEKTPAALAGLHIGDLIVEFAGQKIASNRQFQFLVAETMVDEDVICKIVRNDNHIEFNVRLTEFDTTRSTEIGEAVHWLGLRIGSLASPDPQIVRLKDTLGITAVEGVIVVEITEGLPAADAGIRPGDVLVNIEGHEITDLAAYKEVRSLLSGRHDALSILVRTGTIESYLMVQPRDEGIEN